MTEVFQPPGWPPRDPEPKPGHAPPTVPGVTPPVVHDEQPAIVETAAPRTGGMAKWETTARERVRKGIKKYARPLADLIARDANEGDTRIVVTRLLTDVLGYDEFNDLTTEYQVRGEFADYGIRIDRELVAFIEVKRVATKLNAKHLRQAEMYAVNEGVEWIVLTNGVDWRAYHVSGGLPVEIDLALDVNLLTEEPIGRKSDQLFYLTRESFKRRQIDEQWKARRATSPRSLAANLLSETVTEALRKQLRRETGQNVPTDEIAKLLRETVIKPDCL